MRAAGKHQRSAPAGIRLKRLGVAGEQNHGGVLRTFAERVKYVVVAHLLEFPVLDRLRGVFLERGAIAVYVELFPVNIDLRAGIIENHAARLGDGFDKILVKRAVAETKILLARHHYHGNIPADRIEKIVERVEVGSLGVTHISGEEDIIGALSSDLAGKLGILAAERHTVQVADHHKLHAVEHTRQSVDRHRLVSG